MDPVLGQYIFTVMLVVGGVIASIEGYNWWRKR
mgnify:FL=1